MNILVAALLQDYAMWSVADSGREIELQNFRKCDQNSLCWIILFSKLKALRWIEKRNKYEKEMIVYSVSDLLALRSCCQQLQLSIRISFLKNSLRFPFINKEEELLDILRDAIMMMP